MIQTAPEVRVTPVFKTSFADAHCGFGMTCIEPKWKVETFGLQVGSEVIVEDFDEDETDLRYTGKVTRFATCANPEYVSFDIEETP